MVDKIIKQIEEMGGFPIIVIHRIADIDPLAESLLKAGLPCVEVTFRTDIAEEALKKLKRNYPGLLLGAGTILREEQAKAAFDAGAEFVLAPGLNPRVVEYCLKEGIRIYPGVCTPSEIEQAISMGLRELKFFPAEAMGGIRYLRAVTGPLSMVRFIPTGGINPENLAVYLEFDRILACAGSWIAPQELISEQRFDLITDRATQAVQIVRATRGGK